MIERHIVYFKNFWIKYTELKEKYDLGLFKRKFYLDGLKINNKGTFNQIKWLNSLLHNLNKNHNKIVRDINKLVEDFEKFMEKERIDWYESSYQPSYWNALHGTDYETETESDSFVCSYTREDLAEFTYPESL